MRAFAVCLLLLTSLPCLAAPAPRVLFLGARGNHVAKGLDALGVAVEHAGVGDLVGGERCVFDYSLLVCGMDVRRGRLTEVSEAVRAFVEAVGVVLCFRSAYEDAWLPAPLDKDRAYTLGRVLAPKHAIFTTPHAFDAAKLQAVHGGSIYAGLYSLGKGRVVMCQMIPAYAWFNDAKGEAALRCSVWVGDAGRPSWEIALRARVRGRHEGVYRSDGGD
jgi:hypothetical protein